MGVSWTSEQQKVIDLRERNILVSAAAGSGKTAVLVQRIITMLTDSDHPMDVDKLLVVTFTEAAAAEMKERVRDAIEKELAIHPDDEHLLRQATLIHNAQITTIHSFCLSVIRDHFHAIDLDPGFRIGEEGELKLFRQDVVEELLEDRYQEASERFLDFSMAYGAGKNDKKLEELILKIFTYSRSYPDPEKWLESCLALYEIDSEEKLEKSSIIERIKGQLYALLLDARNILEKAMEIALQANGPYMYEDTLKKDMEVLEQLLSQKTYSDLKDAAAKISFSRISTKKDPAVSVEKRELAKRLRDKAKDITKKAIETFLSDEIDDVLGDLAMCREPLRELILLVQDFARRFEEKKRSQNMIDFSDMEQYAMRILNDRDENGDFVPSAAAKEYQDHYQEIMIDEYQDSNLIQETILTSIARVRSGRHNIFMVGDVKQSIYRFRLSRPELFMEKFHTYSLNESKTQRIDLHKNFRSRAEVLDSVNYIFEKIMVPSLGGIRYDKEAALYCGASYLPYDQLETELLLFDESSAANLELSGKELEAHMIANRIRDLKHEHMVQDKQTGQMRPVRYSDIVILARSLSDYGEILSEVLTKEGIPVYVGTRSGYFGAYEVGVMLDYLQILNNRKQDIPLAAVLTSPFGLMNEEELAAVKISGGKRPLWKTAELIAKGEIRAEDQPCDKDLFQTTSGKLQMVYQTLDHFRAILPYTPIHELLQMIYDETGYMDYLAAMPGGVQRAANLEMLVEKARAFEATSYKGLFHFIRYIEQLRKYDVDYGEASIEDEQSDTVRIMTIHKSKGLEFPIVIVAGMGKNFNLTDARASVVLHSGFGVGLDAVNLADRTKRPSIVKKMIQKEEELDTRGEELRVLYVALTRAKEKLIMTGSLKNLEKTIEGLGEVIPNKDGSLPYFVLSSANSYLSWVLPAIWAEQNPMYKKEIYGAEDVLSESIEEIVRDQVTKDVLLSWEEEGDLAYKELFDQQFGYVYPYAGDKNHKMKFTVTELKKIAQTMKAFEGDADQDDGEPLGKEEEIVPYCPKFITESEELTGAQRGTAYHRFLELVDYTQEIRSLGEEDIRALVKTFVESGKMTPEMGACIRPSDILKFFSTESAGRMHVAAKKGCLFKEQPFVLGISAGQVYEDADEEEMILIQGVIDVYYEEEDGFVILDYKTDKLFKKADYVEKYHAQLDYYGQALEQLRGKQTKEKTIYSVTLGQEIVLK